MTVYKEVEFDVDLEDFELNYILDYIYNKFEDNSTPKYMKEMILSNSKYITNLSSSEDDVYSMGREEFELVFNTMKNSWQNLT
jgi:hypothetical protein